MRRHLLKAFWYFLALSGCRRGEALGLQWTDIDWEQKTATIRTIQVGKASQRRLHAPKTQSGARTLALSDFLAAILRSHQDQQRMAWSVDHAGEPLPPWVFTTRRGTWLARVAAPLKSFCVVQGCLRLPASTTSVTPTLVGEHGNGSL